MSDSTRFLASLMRGEQRVWPGDASVTELARDADSHGATPMIAMRLRRDVRLRVPPEFAAAIHDRARAAITSDIIRGHQVDALV